MLQRLVLTGVLVLAAGVAAVSPAYARPSRPAPRGGTNAFKLFDGVRGLRLNSNRWDCNGITNFGNICTDLSGSGTVEGGYWPNGTPDNYVFNGGLQLAGTVFYNPSSCTINCPWVGDTVGVFFMDPRGDQRQGAAVTNIYNSLNAADVAGCANGPGAGCVWPSAGFVKDPSLYSSKLLGRLSISQQDTWVRYWDGDPSLSAGRHHMMGVLVEQRGLLWNFPSGNQDILYWLFRFINITSTNAADYAGLADAGYSPDDIAEVVNLATDFHNRVLATYGINLPAGGYTFKNLFAAFFQDADEGNASFNFSTAVLPFAMVSVVKSNFSEPTWLFPAAAFSSPFYPAPGYEGVKYLKSPIDSSQTPPRPFGISVFGNTCNGCGLVNDAVGTSQMYRYLSGHLSPALGDGTCNSDPVKLHTCANLQSSADTRFYESSGPFSLAPGQSSVIVVAMVAAAPVAKWAATTNGIYSMPAGTLSPYLGTDASTPGQTFFPGWPASPDSLAVHGTNSGAEYCTTNCGNRYLDAAGIREPIERGMGWGQFSDANGDGIIEQDEVQTVPGSLLDKMKVAQAIFDAKFLLPFAPEAPSFYLIPGDGRVTVVWQKSFTEDPASGGDPYFSVAGDATSALYDPNYRQFDVEGYRIWRGRTAAEMQVIAQFDYSGTSFTDYTGAVINGNFPNCAPELGLSGANCPANFAFPDTTGPSVSYDIGGNLIQVPPGGRTELSSGNVYIISADTAVTGGGTGYPALTDGGVPFAYVDANVLDGFQYFYSVTAFDVNSVKSGPSSLQSAIVPKPVVPRATSGQESAGGLGSVQLVGGDGAVLSGTMPTVDATTGEFSGPMAPANGVGLGFVAFVPQILGTSGSISFVIDSITPGDGWDGASGTYFMTAPGTGAHFTAGPVISLTDGTDSLGAPFPAVKGAQNKSTRYGGDSTYSVYGNAILQFPGTWELTNWGRGAANDAPTGNDKQGPRWWVGSANENTADPNIGMCGAANFGCEPTTAELGQTAGSLGAAIQVMIIEGYMTVPSQPMRQIHAMTSYLARAADFQVYWGAGGAVDSVHDATHHVSVPFSPILRASWGILNDSSFVTPYAVLDPSDTLPNGTARPGDTTRANLTPDKSNAFLRWDDVTCVAPISGPRSIMLSALSTAQACGGTGQFPAVLMNHARLSPVVFASSKFADTLTAKRTPTGNGFIFYIDGQFFMMQMAALPNAGDVWNLRVYAGDIVGKTGSYAWVDAMRPPAVPGLKVQVTYQGSTSTTATSDSIFAAIHTVPDPYYVTNALETSPNSKVLRFVNVPSQCIIRIYSVSGILVRVLTHNDPTNGAEATWDLRNRNNQYVASGVYFYHLEAADGRTKIGRFTVVNYAQ